MIAAFILLMSLWVIYSVGIAMRIIPATPSKGKKK